MDGELEREAPVSHLSGHATHAWEGGTKVAVTLVGAPASSGDGSAVDAIAAPDMAWSCAGEASAEFGVSPRDITTQKA
jgi:hypothetical protein